jgi:hypothetical protein
VSLTAQRREIAFGIILACKASLYGPRALKRGAVDERYSRREGRMGRTLSITTGWFVSTSSNSADMDKGLARVFAGDFLIETGHASTCAHILIPQLAGNESLADCGSIHY